MVKRARQYWKLLLSEAFSFLSYYIYSVHVYNVDLHVHVIHVCLNVEKNVYEIKCSEFIKVSILRVGKTCTCTYADYFIQFFLVLQIKH